MLLNAELKEGADALIHFGLIADNHNVTLDFVKAIFEELTAYTAQLKVEFDDILELDKERIKHSNK